METSASALLLAALERLATDRAEGQLLSLEEYQSLFPGLESELAKRFAAIEGGDGNAADGQAVETERRIGRYRLGEVIGRGGQGIVYRAVDETLRRTVALKLLTRLSAVERGSLDRFLREAMAASRLEHPGICSVYEYGDDDGVPFLAMEFVEGRSLEKVIAERNSTKALPDRDAIAELLTFFEGAARALHAAHDVGVVHRDVKPGNLMVTDVGNPVLLDFGIARIFDEGVTALTMSRESLGTPAYMAPEQISGGSPQVDQRIDVYAIGVSLFEALALRRPFTAPTVVRLFRQIALDPPPDVTKFNPKVPRDVRSVIETAMQKNPAERYANAESLADDLARARQGDPIKAQPPGVLRRLGKWASRNPGAVASLAIITILMTVGAIVVSFLALQTERALTDSERMADAALLDALFDRAEGALWPPHPDKRADYEDWFSQVETLLERRDANVAALAAFRERALPYSQGDRAIDREHYAQFYSNIADVERQRPLLAEQPEALAELEAYDRKLRERVSRRRTFRFADPDETLRHDVLTDLTRRLHNIHVPAVDYHVTLEDMRERHALLLAMEDRLGGEDALAWKRCIADVGRSGSMYAGLSLEPTPGLVPLGRDAESGLWEFWHMGSGARPAWDGEPLGAGSVQLHEDSGSEGLVLVLVPGGTFNMGARLPSTADERDDEPNIDVEASTYEKPVHPVTLDAFLLSKYEVTRGQWLRVMRSDPAVWVRNSAGRPDGTLRNPVVEVDWEACRETCRRWGLRLPTEAQWEYACRAGTTTPYSTGIEASALRSYANTTDWTTVLAFAFQLGKRDIYAMDAPVGSLGANPWGLHDMHGNVSEWCRDGFLSYGMWPHEPGDGMQGPVVGMSLRARRPGSFSVPTTYSRSSARQKSVPEYSGVDVGFRPVGLAPIASR